MSTDLKLRNAAGSIDLLFLCTEKDRVTCPVGHVCEELYCTIDGDGRPYYLNDGLLYSLVDEEPTEEIRLRYEGLAIIDTSMALPKALEHGRIIVAGMRCDVETCPYVIRYRFVFDGSVCVSAMPADLS